jgi:hypothetical protein
VKDVGGCGRDILTCVGSDDECRAGDDFVREGESELVGTGAMKVNELEFAVADPKPEKPENFGLPACWRRINA